jgi:hypothetical protein
MSKPSTRVLDHIVHLTPPGTIEETAQQFRDLGFTYATSYTGDVRAEIKLDSVLQGGKHTGGLSENCIVVCYNRRNSNN